MELPEDASVKPPKGIFVSFSGGFNDSWFAETVQQVGLVHTNGFKNVIKRRNNHGKIFTSLGN